MKISFPSEKAIEDYVWSKLEEGEECPIAGEEYDFCLRQKEIKGYGITDIIKVQADEAIINITILELKNEDIKESHISQLYRYMAGVKRVAKLYSRKIKNCPEIYVYGELAGPFNKNRGDIVWLIQGLQDITCHSISIDFDNGFKSKEISAGWVRADEKRLSYRNEVRQIAKCHAEAERLFLDMMHGYKSENVTSINGGD